MVDMRHLLFFLRRCRTCSSLEFASAKSWGLVMFVAAVCFQRCGPPLVRGIVREWKRWNVGGEKRDREIRKNNGVIYRWPTRVPPLPHDRDAKSNELDVRSTEVGI